MKLVEMNKDIREYKEKLIGPFSGRETICLLAGLGFFALIKYLFFPDWEAASEQSSYLLLGCVIPFVAVGWGRFYGMYIEDFIKCAMSSFLAPRVRKYDNGIRRERRHIKTVPSKDKERIRIR